MAAINLLELQPQRISRNLKGKFMMFYGLPGVGKTSLAAQFPKSLIFGFEQGTNGLDNVYVQPIKTWVEWKTAAGQLLRKSEELLEKFETIVIDTADAAWNLCIKYICGEYNVTNIGDIGYGKGYVYATEEFSSIFRDLTYAGFTIIFISHSTEKTFKDENGEEYTQINPALPTRAYDIINKMVDIIGYIRNIEIESNVFKRYVFFRGDNRFFAKSRFEFIEPKVELDYKKIVDAIQVACDKAAQHNGLESATESENPYTALNFDELIGQAKQLFIKAEEKGKVEKISEILQSIFGKPTRFSEILPEDAELLRKALAEITAIL